MLQFQVAHERATLQQKGLLDGTGAEWFVPIGLIEAPGALALIPRLVVVSKGGERENKKGSCSAYFPPKAPNPKGALLAL